MSDETLAPEPDAAAPADAAQSDQPVPAADAPAPDVSTMTNPPPAETPSSEPVAAATPVDPDPLTIAQADVARLTAENKKLAEDLERVTQEHTQLHLALDAERRKPSHEDLAHRNIMLKDQLERVTRERDLLKEQVPGQLEAVQSASVELSDASIERIKAVFLEALAEHAIAQVAEEPAPAAEPQSPFISRGN